MSTQRAPAQRVPAWKRLGLKLKGAAPEGSPASGPPEPRSTNVGANNSASAHQAGFNADVNGRNSRALTQGSKRKQPPYTSASGARLPSDETPNKRPRKDDSWSSPAAASQKPARSVTFAEGTKSASGDVSIDHGDDDLKSTKKNKKKKTKKSKSAKAGLHESFSLEPALAYLRQWDTARDSWKFNKNHQTLLIKYLFDEGKIPAAEIAIFYKYIRDLKGGIRSRLRDTAKEIREKDMEQGVAGFPEPTKAKEDKQKEYEEVLSQFIRDQQRPNSTNGVNSNGKRTFDEVEFVLRTISPETKQRVIKRMRAEMVLGELSDSEESTTSATTSTTASSSTVKEAAEPQTEKRVKLNDGSQRTKRRRMRNVRTDGMGSDDSSTESDSDSSSASSSGSSSSEDSEDEEMPLAADLNGLEESSSSSSSSSSSDSESDSESGSESGSGAETEGESEESDDE